MLEIKDSVAVITGGGGGIGLAIAIHWIMNGGKVVIADVAEKMLKQAEAELRELGGEVATVDCNVTDEDDCARLADTAIEKFGQINLGFHILSDNRGRSVVGVVDILWAQAKNDCFANVRLKRCAASFRYCDRKGVGLDLDVSAVLGDLCIEEIHCR